MSRRYKLIDEQIKEFFFLLFNLFFNQFFIHDIATTKVKSIFKERSLNVMCTLEKLVLHFTFINIKSSLYVYKPYLKLFMLKYSKLPLKIFFLLKINKPSQLVIVEIRNVYVW